MTEIYFVRHAQPDHHWKEDRTRPLTAEGIQDAGEVTKVLKDRDIKHIISSPYQRTIDTVHNLAESLQLKIETEEDFRERNAGSWLGNDFLHFIRKQWDDFDYHIEDGESLNQVQERNIRALKKVLRSYSDESIVIATHGTALSTILNYYDKEYNFDSFMRMIDYMPYIIRMEFDGEICTSITEEFILKKEFK